MSTCICHIGFIVGSGVLKINQQNNKDTDIVWLWKVFEMLVDGHTEGCCGWILEFSWTILILLSSPSLQEEVLPLLCALRCLHTWWAAFNETKGEVWVEETFSTMVFNTCSLQVNMSIGKWVICLTCKCFECVYLTYTHYMHLSICLQHLLMLKHICFL